MISQGELYGLPYISKGSYAKVYGNDYLAVKIYTDYETHCVFSVLREGLILSSGRIGPKFRGIATDFNYRFKGLVMDRAIGTLANKDRDVNSFLSCYRDAVGDLCFLHSRGLVHGDIKPANILVMPDGRGTLCDFGLMTFANGYGPIDCLQEELYTPMFRSPELLDSLVAFEVSLSDDIWALGISMYTAFIQVTNRHKIDEVEELHMSILRTDPAERQALYANRMLPNLGHEKSIFIAELLSRCLEPDPSKRITAPMLYALMTSVAKVKCDGQDISKLISPKNDLMPRYNWVISKDQSSDASEASGSAAPAASGSASATSDASVSASSIMSCDSIAKNVWSLVHIYVTSDNPLLKSCRDLFSLLKTERWPNNKSAVIAAVICGSLVRRSTRFQSTWCSKIAGCSISEYDFSLGQAISLAITNRRWSNHCLSFED
jgi:serine/threonine protein kinase